MRFMSLPPSLATGLAGLALLALPDAGRAGQPCGGDIACLVDGDGDGGEYRIELPQDGDTRGVLVYFHGYKSSGEDQMRHRQLVETALAHHLAFAAVDGKDGSWSFPNTRSGTRDDMRFIGKVFDDLQSRYGFTADKRLVGGFSIGASMAWYTACQQGGRVAGMVTFSGVFWNPLPKPADCVAALPPMIHFHGTADRTFPLAGRPIGKSLHQGDTFKSIAIYRDRAQCDLPAAGEMMVEEIACDAVPHCRRGASTACIHAGGHEVRADLLDAGLTALGFAK